MNDLNNQNLTQTLDELSQIQGERVSIDEILQKFRSRGFGPFLLAPCLITILPTGAIPMVPALSGVVIAFTCVQLLLGLEHPWLPSRLREFTIPKGRLKNGIYLARPYTAKIDKILHERLTLFLHPLSKILTATVSLLLSLIMILIGFIPMLPATLALPIFFFGLGFIARDGLIIALGYVTIIGSAAGMHLLVSFL